jgi:hypothetical protein
LILFINVNSEEVFWGVKFSFQASMIIPEAVCTEGDISKSFYLQREEYGGQNVIRQRKCVLIPELTLT